MISEVTEGSDLWLVFTYQTATLAELGAKYIR